MDEPNVVKPLMAGHIGLKPVLIDPSSYATTADAIARMADGGVGRLDRNGRGTVMSGSMPDDIDMAGFKKGEINRGNAPGSGKPKRK